MCSLCVSSSKIIIAPKIDDVKFFFRAIKVLGASFSEKTVKNCLKGDMVSITYPLFPAFVYGGSAMCGGYL